MAADETNQSQPAGRIMDARGRSVTQLDPVAMHLLRRPGIVPPDVLREIAQDVGIGLTKAHRVTDLCLFSLTILKTIGR